MKLHQAIWLIAFVMLAGLVLYGIVGAQAPVPAADTAQVNPAPPPVPDNPPLPADIPWYIKWFGGGTWEIAAWLVTILLGVAGGVLKYLPMVGKLRDFIEDLLKFINDLLVIVQDGKLTADEIKQLYADIQKLIADWNNKVPIPQLKLNLSAPHDTMKMAMKRPK